MASLSCLTLLEPGRIGSDSGNVVIPTTEVQFPPEVLIYALIFIVARNSFNIAVI